MLKLAFWIRTGILQFSSMYYKFSLDQTPKQPQSFQHALITDQMVDNFQTFGHKLFLLKCVFFLLILEKKYVNSAHDQHFFTFSLHFRKILTALQPGLNCVTKYIT